MKGILVILEKKPGVINISKLRAILLLEADFNGLNKIIFNLQFIPRIEQVQVISNEIISSR